MELMLITKKNAWKISRKNIEIEIVDLNTEFSLILFDFDFSSIIVSSRTGRNDYQSVKLIKNSPFAVINMQVCNKIVGNLTKEDSLSFDRLQMSKFTGTIVRICSVCGKLFWSAIKKIRRLWFQDCIISDVV